MTNEQLDAFERITGPYPATHFTLLDTREDGTRVYEWDDLESAGVFTISPEGAISYPFTLREGPDPYRTGEPAP